VGASAATGLLPQPDLTPSFEWLRGESFQLRAVEVLGLDVLDSERLVASTGLRAGIPLIEVDLERVSEAIRSHPRVASCRSAHLPPDRLLFEIEERVPVAALAGGAEGIDLAGERFPLVAGESAALPRLRGDPAAALPLIAAARAAQAPVRHGSGAGHRRLEAPGGERPARALLRARARPEIPRQRRLGGRGRALTRDSPGARGGNGTS
jgi:hypothetical protein